MGILDGIDELPPLQGKNPGGDGGVFGGMDELPAIGSADHAPARKAIEPKVVEDARRPADDGEISLGDALSSAGKNLLPSSGRALKQTARALTVDLPETVDAVKQLGKGAVSKIGGALGVDQDPAEKEKNEAVLNALGAHYKETYGSMKGFKNALAKDPASILMDVATPISGGLGAGAKMAGTASSVGRALKIASKAAQYADPVSATVGAAGAAAKGANQAVKGITSFTAKVPKSALDLAQAAGSTGNKTLRDAFDRHYSGAGDSSEIFDAAQDALEKVKAKNSAQYLATKNGLAAKQNTANFSGIQAAVDALPGDINKRAGAHFVPDPRNPGQYVVAGIPPHHFDGSNAVAAKVKGLVEDYAANPSSHTFEGLDTLKQAIHDATVSLGFRDGSKEYAHAMKVYGAVKNELEAVAPGYNQLMEQWSNARNGVQALKTLGISDKGNAVTALNKLLRAEKSHTGKDLISTLANEREDLPYMLAGAHLNPYTHSGGTNLLDLVLGGGGLYLTGGAHGLAALSLTSPRMMGGVQRGIGAVERAADYPAAHAAMYTAKELRPGEGDAPPDQKPEQKTQQSAPAPAADTRGVRNNNGGNIIDGPFAKSQPGYAGADPHPGPNGEIYAKFETPDHGEKASLALLKSYGSRGYDTVRKIAERWTPRGPNPDSVVDGKIAAMKRFLGVSADQRLDMSNPDLLRRVYESIFGTENGKPRTRRASGGRVVNHEKEALRLIDQAERGLRHQNKKTEPLLNIHDDVVADALKAADKYI